MFAVNRQGAVNVLTGKDTLTEPNIEDLDRLFQQCLGEPSPRIVFNLSDVPLFDSVGLEWLLDAAERCVERGGQLQIAAPGALCRDILSATGVGDQFEHFDDVRAAVRSFTR